MAGIRQSRSTISVLAAGIVAAGALVMSPPAAADVGPPLAVTTVVSGLDIPWDLTFTPDGTMLFDQRAGSLQARLTTGEVRTVTADMSDLYASDESGLMGLVVDPQFSSNRTFYTCQGHTGGDGRDVRVVKWQVDTGYTRATRVQNVVTGIQNNARHSGCRLRFDANGLLYVGTGDATVGTNPQDLTSLNGKVLRVTTAGAPAPGNPFISSGNAKTRLVYTYGHRNVQGLSLRPGTNEMWSVEQGTGRDDEVNRLVAGGNYGYDPVPGYNEGVPMTDLAKYPNAVPAVFATGAPTLALSGGTWLSGSQWGGLDGVFIGAALKASQLKALRISPQNVLQGSVDVPELQGTYGRLREPVQGPDGALYVTTSNGSGNDRILRVAPTTTPGETVCAGPPATPGTPVAATVSGADLLTFVVGTDRAVWYRKVDGAGPWTSLGGIASYGPAAVSSAGGRVDVFVVGYEGILNHGWLSNAGRWSGWERLGGTLTSSPAAVSFDDGTLVVAGRGTDRALWSLRGTTGGGWTSWNSAGGSLSAAPGAAVDPDTGVGRVGVRGDDGRIFTMPVDRTGPTGGYVASGVVTCSAVAYATRSGDGSGFAVGYVGYEGRSSVFDGSAHLLGGTLTGSLALVTPGQQGYAVLGRGVDRGLWIYDARSGSGGWRSLGGTLS